MIDEAMKIVFKILFLGISFLFYAGLSNERFNPEEINNKERVAIAFEKWQQGTGNFFDLLHEQVEWTVAGTGFFSGTYKGKQQFLEKAVLPINDQLATNIKPELIDIMAEGKIVWLHWEGIATAKNGSNYHNEYAWKLEFNKGKVVKAHAFLDSSSLDKLFITNLKTMQTTIEDTKEYVGMWVTKDGYIRHELLPNNRYDEARGNRSSAYQGSYKVTGNHIDYKDDTGFTADGVFKEGILYHAGMILYKEKN